MIKEVLETESDSLLALNDKIWNFLLTLHKPAVIRAAMKRTFSENHFFKKETRTYNAYHLCSRIGLQTCPYCNIIPIPTVSKSGLSVRIARPPLDHFFANKHYPLLAISFFNLVPGCDTCNSRFKLATKTHHLTYLNPHSGCFADDCIFQFKKYKKIDDILAPGATGFEIKLKNKTGDLRFDGNKKLFHLDDMYSPHKSAARTCLINSKNYSKAMVKSILTIARRTGSDAFEQIFHSRFALEELHLHSLSKLKRDIVMQYGDASLKKELGI